MASKSDPSAYSAVLATVGLPSLEESAIRLSRSLEADGAVAQASLVRQAFLRLLDELKSIARSNAAYAQETIKAEEKKTRVRPDTEGHGDKRLETYVGESRPLDAVEGSVGVNFEPALYENVPWWWTNEEGYSGHVGRVVHGFFYDAGFTGRSRPDFSQSREHPLFRAEGPQRGSAIDDGGAGMARRQKRLMAARSRGKGVRPGMLIQNPIPARRFVERGVAKAETRWHEKVRAARQRFITACEKAVAQAPPPRLPRRP